VHPAGNSVSEPIKTLDCPYNRILILLGKSVVERQPYESIADVFRYRAPPLFSTEPLSHGAQMERNVVKHTVDSLRFQVRNESLSFLNTRHQEIEHVIRLITTVGDHGEPNPGISRP
jgi:hypothetical protein